MGQYYKVVNLDKKQYLHPHKFGDGLKLLEFGASGCGTMCGLAILLADGNGRGGGDLNSENPLVGSWAGDRIVVAGDYADPGRFCENLSEPDIAAAAQGFSEGYQTADRVNLYSALGSAYQDISEEVIQAMCDDKYLKLELQQATFAGKPVVPS